MGLYVVLGDYVLLVEVVHLLAQVDGIGIHITAATHGNDFLCTVDERNDYVDAGLQRGIILAETLDNLGLRLGNDDKTFLDQHKRADNQRDKYVNEDVHILNIL